MCLHERSFSFLHSTVSRNTDVYASGAVVYFRGRGPPSPWRLKEAVAVRSKRARARRPIGMARDEPGGERWLPERHGKRRRLRREWSVQICYRFLKLLALRK